MIRYDLVCSDGHEFDGWFANSGAFEKQAAAKLIDCPHCGDTAVSKAIMAPRISRTGETATAVEQKMQPAPASKPPEMAEVIALLRRIKAHVLENAEDVGEHFAEEARKIHYNETESRSIYGEASPDDARALVEEGIEIHTLPVLPEEAN